MRVPSAETRYNRVAMILHWLIALSIVGMIYVGWQLEDLPDAERFALTQVHKSMGITILLLTLVRLSWRLMNPVPALPDGMKGWEIFAAKATHIGFYALLILMPVSGWAMASASPYGIPTLVFGTFTWPHLPGLSDLPLTEKKAAAERIGSVHSALAWVMIVLLVLHVGAALKHHVVNKDAVLKRMVPFWKQGTHPAAKGRGLFIAIGVGLAALALGVWLGQSRPATAAPLADEATVSTPLAERASQPEAIADLPQDEGALNRTQTLSADPEPIPLPSSRAEPSSTDPTPSPSAPSPSGPNAPGPEADRTPPADWRASADASEIRFSGTHDGKAFAGTFSNWRADIRFDPDQLTDARIIVRVDMASARTGDAFYDGTLPEADWFDVKRHPEARFEADSISTSQTGFVVSGNLTIKDRTVPVSFPFALSIEGDSAVMSGQAILDRTALGLGVASDPNGGWVSTDIVVDIALRANRKS